MSRCSKVHTNNSYYGYYFSWSRPCGYRRSGMSIKARPLVPVTFRWCLLSRTDGWHGSRWSGNF